MSYNPLVEVTARKLEQHAAKFWDENELRAIVSKDDFIVGALAFRNLDDALKRTTTTQMGADTNDQTNAKHPPDLRSHTGLERLNHLNHQQISSLRAYLQKPPPEVTPLSFLPKRWFYLMMEFVLDLEGTLNRRKQNGNVPNNQKSNWDHLRLLSRTHLTVIATGILAAVTQGWDQSSMNGANLEWPNAFGLDICQRSSTVIFAVLNAAPFWSGAVVGSLVSDTVINEWRFGRRWAIFLAGLFSAFSVIGAAFTQNWKTFLLCRILLGFGMGGKASVVPIFISEISPEEIRGMLVMCWQLFDTFGILLGNLANLAVYQLVDYHSKWRIMIALPFVPALMFLTLVLFCVEGKLESPRWLLKRGKMREALKALIRLHDFPSPIVACGELYLTFLLLKNEEIKYFKRRDTESGTLAPALHRTSNTGQPGDTELRDTEILHNNGGNASSTGFTSPARPARERTVNAGDAGTPSGSQPHITKPQASTAQAAEYEKFSAQNLVLLNSTRWLDRVRLFRVRRVRNAVWATMCVMIAQQACGINILAFMSSTIFDEASTKPCISEPRDYKQNLLYSVYFGITNFVCTWIAFPLIDFKGRKYLLNISFPVMGTCLFAVGGILYLDDSRKRTILFQVFTTIFTAAFSLGEGPIAFVIPSEVFPLIVREMGMSFAVFCNFTCAGVLGFLTPILKDRMTHGGFWFLFGTLNFFFWFLSFIFVRETQRKSLEIIDKTYDETIKDALLGP